MLTTGDGSTAPLGFLDSTSGISNGGTASGTATGSSTDNWFGYADLADLYGSLEVPYRENGSWLVATSAYTHILKMRDDNKLPVLDFSPTQGRPTTLFGAPIHVVPSMTALGSATTSVAFGDFRQAFTVARVNPVRVNLSLDHKLGNDQVALRVLERVASAVPDPNAAAYMVAADT